MFEIRKSNLQLFLTRRCQLRCTYCPVDKGDRDMDVETLRAAVDLLMTHKSPEVRLDFSGGEPLLRFDLLEEALRCAAVRAAGAGKQVSFYMVTNAIGMTPKIVETLRGYDICVNLSLDGGRKTNNEHRLPHRPGNMDPYRDARRGIDLALKAGLDCCGVLVVTPGAAPDLVENVAHLFGLGLRAVEINCAIGSFWRPEDTAVLFARFDELLRRYGRSLGEGRLKLVNLAGRLEPAALNSELIVDCDGSLHILSEWLFETTPASGRTVFDFGDVRKIRDINSLYWDRFHAYYSLVRLYRDELAVRKTLLNNIGLGERVGRYFQSVKEGLHGTLAFAH